MKKNERKSQPPAHEGIRDKFGDAFVSDFYIPLPSTLYPLLKSEFKLKRHEASFLVCLLDFASIKGDGTCNPGFGALKELDPWLSDSSIASSIGVLEEKLGLTVVRGGHDVSNVYDLTEPLRRINEARKGPAPVLTSVPLESAPVETPAVAPEAAAEPTAKKKIAGMTKQEILAMDVYELRAQNSDLTDGEFLSEFERKVSGAVGPVKDAL